MAAYVALPTARRSDVAALRGRRGARHLHHRAAGREPRRHGVSPEMTTTRVAGAPAAPRRGPAPRSPRRPRSPSTTTAASWCAGRVPVAVPKGASHPAGRARRARSGLALLARLRRSPSSGLAYDGAVDEGSVLRRSVGRRVVFRLPESRDTVSALVLGVDPLRLQLPDGRMTFSPPGAAHLSRPTSSSPTRPRRSDLAERRARRTGSGSATSPAARAWQASYQVRARRERGAGDRHARCSSRQTLRAEDAEVQLLAGAVGRAQAPGRRSAMAARALMAAMAMTTRTADASSGSASSICTRSPAGPRSSPGLTTSVALFEPAQVKYERQLRGARPGAVLGLPAPAGRGDRGAGRGDATPSSGRGRPSSAIARCPAASRGCSRPTAPAGRSSSAKRRWTTPRPARTSGSRAGIAFDLTARRVQTDLRHPPRQHQAGWRTVATADYRVTVRNADRQRRHGRRARGAERRVERAAEQRPGRRRSRVHDHPVPGGGAARPGRGDQLHLSDIRRRSLGE